MLSSCVLTHVKEDRAISAPNGLLHVNSLAMSNMSKLRERPHTRSLKTKCRRNYARRVPSLTRAFHVVLPLERHSRFLPVSLFLSLSLSLALALFLSLALFLFLWLFISPEFIEAERERRLKNSSGSVRVAERRADRRLLCSHVAPFTECAIWWPSACRLAHIFVISNGYAVSPGVDSRRRNARREFLTWPDRTRGRHVVNCDVRLSRRSSARAASICRLFRSEVARDLAALHKRCRHRLLLWIQKSTPPLPRSLWEDCWHKQPLVIQRCLDNFRWIQRTELPWFLPRIRNFSIVFNCFPNMCCNACCLFKE